MKRRGVPVSSSGRSGGRDGERGRVEEQSHKSDMRAALRGDFERLRVRRQSGVDPAPEIRQDERGAGQVVRPDGAVRESWLARLRGRR